MKKIFGIILIVLLFWSILIEPNLLTVKKYKIVNQDLSGFRIIFVSDFHLKSGVSHRLDRLVAKIKEQKPDILLLGGDFFEDTQNEDISVIDSVIASLGSLKPTYGVFAVLGNHEWLVSRNKAKNLFKKHGVVLLSDENKCLSISNKKLCVVGLEDILFQNVDISKAMRGVEKTVILLSHSPDVFGDIPNNVDLVLAGHTHGGQVNIPFVGRPIVPSAFGDKYAYGLIEEDGKKMIVTSGIGTSILPIRFNCPPEIVVVDFCKE